MTWTKLDDCFYDNPKIDRAPLRAVGLYCKLLTYCNRHLTDGFFDMHPVSKMVGVGVSSGEVLQELVDFGLVDCVENGYQIHDFLDYNEPSKVIKKRRTEAVERASRGGVKSGEVRRNRKGIGTKRPASSSPVEAGGLKQSNEVPTLPVPTLPYPSIKPLEVKTIVPTSRDESLVSRVRGVLEHYRQAHPGNKAQPDGKEGKLIAARLREGSTVEELKTASDGYHASPWHCGQNDRKTVYLDLGLIYRDAGHVAKGIELWQQRHTASLDAVTRANMSAAQVVIAAETAKWEERQRQKQAGEANAGR